LSAPVT